MRITVQDEVLFGSLPDVCAPHYLEAAVDFARALKTAYADALSAQYPAAEVNVRISAQLLRGFDGGLRVVVDGEPGVQVHAVEAAQAMLEYVRERCWRAWLDRFMAP